MYSSSPSPQTCGGGGEVEAAGEHRAAVQHRPFVVVEQVVGPPHRVAQRLVALQPAPRSRQQPEPVTETVPHLLGAHRHHPRRRQLDRQRDPVQAPADLRHRRRRRRLASCEPRVDRLGRVPRTAPPPPTSAPAATSSDGTGHRCSAADPQALPRGGDHLHRRAPGPGSPRPGRRRRPARARSCPTRPAAAGPTAPAAMLSVTVQPGLRGDAQRRWPPRRARRRGRRRGPARPATPRRGTPPTSSAATWTARRVLPTPPTPVSVTSRCARTSSTSSFTSTSRPTKLVTCTGRFPGAASTVRNGGNVDRQTLGAHLEEVLDARQVPQPVLTQIAQLDARHQRRGRRRAPGSGRRGRRPSPGPPGSTPARSSRRRALGLTGMHPHPHRQTHRRRPRLRPQLLLRPPPVHPRRLRVKRGTPLRRHPWRTRARHGRQQRSAGSRRGAATPTASHPGTPPTDACEPSISVNKNVTVPDGRLTDRHYDLASNQSSWPPPRRRDAGVHGGSLRDGDAWSRS